MKSDEIATICGGRGFGKTTLAKEIISKLSRVAIYDPMAEYEHVNSYVPQVGNIDEFEAWLKPLWGKGNIYIVVDEADIVAPVHKPMSFYMNKIVNLGRHRNIGMCAITRRVSNLNKTLFGLSSTVYMFHHFLPNDLRYLGEFYPDAKKLIELPKYQYLTFES